MSGPLSIYFCQKYHKGRVVAQPLVIRKSQEKLYDFLTCDAVSYGSTLSVMINFFLLLKFLSTALANLIIFSTDLPLSIIV